MVDHAANGVVLALNKDMWMGAKVSRYELELHEWLSLVSLSRQVVAKPVMRISSMTVICELGSWSSLIKLALDCNLEVKKSNVKQTYYVAWERSEIVCETPGSSLLCEKAERALTLHRK